MSWNSLISFQPRRYVNGSAPPPKRVCGPARSSLSMRHSCSACWNSEACSSTSSPIFASTGSAPPPIWSIVDGRMNTIMRNAAKTARNLFLFFWMKRYMNLLRSVRGAGVIPRRGGKGSRRGGQMRVSLAPGRVADRVGGDDERLLAQALRVLARLSGGRIVGVLRDDLLVQLQCGLRVLRALEDRGRLHHRLDDVRLARRVLAVRDDPHVSKGRVRQGGRIFAGQPFLRLGQEE